MPKSNQRKQKKGARTPYIYCSNGPLTARQIKMFKEMEKAVSSSNFKDKKEKTSP